jgi:hypothetical protein
VLFSNEQVARVLNEQFEPVWQSVRPVPMIHIDFGNGRTVTRTLHGNIACYVCAGDGVVIDILPGIYTASAYSTGLTQIRSFAASLDRSLQTPRATQLWQYHQQQVAMIRNNQVNPNGARRADEGKGVIERRVERAIGGNVAIAPGIGTVPRGLGLGTWQALVEDTKLNETQRRLQIHEKLAVSPLLRPEQIKSWLYKTTLNSDLDDPYLGLGDVLAASDVFPTER